MALKLTKKLIDSFAYEGRDNKRDIRWDSDMRGFGVRIYPGGVKSFVISYRKDGRKRLMVLGQYGQITLEQARDIARKRFGEVADQKDPLALKQARKKKHEWTVQKAFNEFLAKYAKEHTRHWKETERAFKKDVLPYWGKRPIDEISREDVIKLLDRVQDRGSSLMANRTLAYVRKFFNWCVERSLIQFNPADKIGKPAPETSRDRVLNDAELKEIWFASDKLGYPLSGYIKTLILTAQRRGETAAMKWEELDFEEKVWMLPPENTKSNRRHVVPLSPMASQLLEKTPNTGDYVFSYSGNNQLKSYGRAKAALDKVIKEDRKKDGQVDMFPWRLHDFRRTAASGMARLGVSPHIVEKILNHSSGTISGVAAVYNRYDYADEMREALDLWADHIHKILTTEIKQGVVRIKKSKNS